jgi:hypothetical protein
MQGMEMARANRHFIPGCIWHITRRCLVYIDLNTVRAGVVNHPAEWAFGGYHEIQGNRGRNRLLDLEVLSGVAETGYLESLARCHREWIEEALSFEGRQQEATRGVVDEESGGRQ